MTLKQLKIFMEVCKHDSFTVADKQLYMTQQAVSHSITSLENSLGCHLFYRAAGKMRLTEHGEFLRDNCAKLLRDADVLQNKMNRRLTEEEVINVGFGLGMMRHFPPDLFANFRHKYPEYKFQAIEIRNTEGVTVLT